LSDYLVGHWELTKDFKDSSGNDNDGIPTDIEWKPTSRGMKPINSTTVGYISYGSDKSLDCSGHVPFTLSFIFHNILGKTQFLCGSGLGLSLNADNGFFISKVGSLNRIFFDIYSTTTRVSLTYNLPVNGQFVHIAVSWDGYGHGKIYYNGILVNESDVGITEIGLQHPFTTHGDSVPSASNSQFNEMDNVRLYKNTELDDTEVLALYNSTKETYGVTYAERSYTHRLSPEITDDAVFATDMSTKNADGTLVDLSGHSNHGTVTGAVRSG